MQGADRSGKTTQCTNLTKHLQEAGHKVELWRFPDRETQIGQMINGYLTSKTNLSDQAVRARAVLASLSHDCAAAPLLGSCPVCAWHRAEVESCYRAPC